MLARWGGTCTILIAHVQGIGLIGSLDLAWPPTVQSLMGFFSFDFLAVRQLTCLLPPLTAATAQLATLKQFAFNFAVCGSFLGVFVALSLSLVACHAVGNAATADVLELVVSIVFSVPLVTTWRSIASLAGPFVVF